MTPEESALAVARNQAGRDAVETIHLYGLDMGAEIIAGRARAYILAHVAVRGWDETIKLFDELRATAVVPRPAFSVVEGGRSA